MSTALFKKVKQQVKICLVLKARGLYTAKEYVGNSGCAHLMTWTCKKWV